MWKATRAAFQELSAILNFPWPNLPSYPGKVLQPKLQQTEVLVDYF